MPLRIIFMGTPDFAVPTLLELAGRGHDIAAVYTRAPKPGGRRGLQLQPTPVELKARELGFPVLTPKTLRTDEALAEFKSHEADVAIVVAYGLILPQAILDAMPRGCFNLHASLLPRWRGAAPIHRAIMSGDSEAGAMVMKMDAGLDTGDICVVDRTMAVRIGISDAMTTADLHDQLAAQGARFMGDAMAALEAGTLEFRKQPQDGVTYAEKIDKAEAHIDFSKPAHAVLRQIHGLSPFPGAWCELPCDSEMARVKVLRVELAGGNGPPGTLLDDNLAIACGEGAIRLLAVQRAGKQVMTSDVFLRGTRVAAGGKVG
jgi:methionyl-tRNA formyltransferase